MHQLVYAGVRELVKNYRIDGIHIDDYFYPTTDAGIDSLQYKTYCDAGGTDALADWRCATINAFLAGLYSTVKAENPQVLLSVSPTGSLEKNLCEQYADVREWVCTPGYLDIIMPQLYYGFMHETMPFVQAANVWDTLPLLDSIYMVWGLAVYKYGQKDENAGSGSQEWIENDDIIVKQIQFLQQLKHYNGFAMFSYKYIN